MSANTRLLIKRSLSTSTPSTSDVIGGELAYSYASNTLFIGDSAGGTPIAIGGSGLISSLSANLVLTDASSNTENIDLATQQLLFQGQGTISANVFSNISGQPEVLISVDDSHYLKSNTGSSSDNQIISSSLQVDGNLSVNGTITSINSTTVETGETILVLANNNTSGDTSDTGFVSKYNNGSANLYAGLIRDASGSYANEYVLFTGLGETSPGTPPTGVDIGSVESSGQLATLHANVRAQLVTAEQLRTTDAGIQLGAAADAGNTKTSSTLSPNSIAIGYQANANTAQSIGGAIAIGSNVNTGVTPGRNSVSIGRFAQATSTSGISIGQGAQANGQDGSGNIGSIVLNADAFVTTTSTQEGFYVNPIREVSSDDFIADNNSAFMTYNSNTKELRYVQYLDGGSF